MVDFCYVNWSGNWNEMIIDGIGTEKIELKKNRIGMEKMELKEM